MNLDDAQIVLKGFELHNCFDTPKFIGQKLAIRYKESLLKQIFFLIGSIDLIGNPVGLFNNIGAGMQDLVMKPAEGFVKGPLEGGLGIV